MDEETREFLRTVVKTYANTPPKPIENLRKIEKIITDAAPNIMDYPYGQNGYYSVNWDDQLLFETIIQLSMIGYSSARKLLEGDEEERVAFMDMANGYDASFSIHDYKESLLEIYYKAFCELYSCYKNNCPCNYERAETLVENGIIPAGNSITFSQDFPNQKILDTKVPKWKRPKCLSCVECNHLHYVTIMDHLSRGEYRYMDSIVLGYHKTGNERTEWCPGKKSLVKVQDKLAYGENIMAFPKYLIHGLPCNALIDLLSSDPKEITRIKQCPYCKLYFFAEDAKRKICYNIDCKRTADKFRTTYKRETEPGTYGSIDPDNEILKNQLYQKQKAIWESKPKMRKNNKKSSKLSAAM